MEEYDDDFEEELVPSPAPDPAPASWATGVDAVTDAIARATGIPPAVANAHAQFDGDHDGQITIDETFGALKFIGVPIASAAAAQVLAALEGSTSLGVSEFNDVVKQLRAVDPAAPAAPAFTPTKPAA